VEDLSETLNKEIENIKKKNQSEMNSISKIKNTLEVISHRLEEAEEISDLEDRVRGKKQAEQEREKKKKQ